MTTLALVEYVQKGHRKSYAGYVDGKLVVTWSSMTPSEVNVDHMVATMLKHSTSSEDTIVTLRKEGEIKERIKVARVDVEEDVERDNDSEA